MATARKDQPGKIRVLDNATIDRIAAGEVVERPASIVKELAGERPGRGRDHASPSSCEEGGLAACRSRTTATASPSAICPWPSSATPPARSPPPRTSCSVGSFGFRGEALASIASVSRVRCTQPRRHRGHGRPDGTRRRRNGAARAGAPQSRHHDHRQRPVLQHAGPPQVHEDGPGREARHDAHGHPAGPGPPGGPLAGAHRRRHRPGPAPGRLADRPRPRPAGLRR